MSEPMWKTKDGTVLLISEMTDQHILNTLAFIRRFYNHTISQGYEFLGFLNPDTVAFDIFSDNLMNKETEGYDPANVCPEYDNLYDEAYERNLIDISGQPTDTTTEGDEE